MVLHFENRFDEPEVVEYPYEDLPGVGMPKLVKGGELREVLAAGGVVGSMYPQKTFMEVPFTLGEELMAGTLYVTRRRDTPAEIRLRVGPGGRYAATTKCIGELSWECSYHQREKVHLSRRGENIIGFLTAVQRACADPEPLSIMDYEWSSTLERTYSLIKRGFCPKWKEATDRIQKIDDIFKYASEVEESDLEGLVSRLAQYKENVRKGFRQLQTSSDSLFFEYDPAAALALYKRIQVKAGLLRVSEDL